MKITNRKRPIALGRNQETNNIPNIINSASYGSNADSDDGLDGEMRFNYRDFGTIDWFRELALDHKRHRKLRDKSNDKSATVVTYLKGKTLHFKSFSIQAIRIHDATDNLRTTRVLRRILNQIIIIIIIIIV